eukprot:g14943.t1
MRHAIMLLALLLLVDPARGAANPCDGGKKGGDTSGDVGEACSPYKLQSEAHVKNFLGNLEETKDTHSAAYRKLVKSMTEMSDEEYMTLQTKLTERKDKKTAFKIDTDGVLKAMKSVKAMHLPPSIMRKLLYSDGDEKRGVPSEFVKSVGALRAGAHAVLDKLMEVDVPDDVDTHDAFDAESVEKVTGEFFAGHKGKALADMLGKLPNLAAVVGVLQKVNETTTELKKHPDSEDMWETPVKNIWNKTMGELWKDKKFKEAVGVEIPGMVDDVDEKLNVTAKAEMANDVAKEAESTLAGIGTLLDGLTGTSSDDAMKEMKLGLHDIVNITGKAAKDGIAGLATGTADVAARRMVESDEVNRNTINRQLGDLGQKMASAYIGKGYKFVKDVTSPLPGSAEIFATLEALDLDDFIKETIPKLLRLTLDTMYSYGPAWLRAGIRNMGGFAGAADMFVDALDLFTKKKALSLLESLQNLFTGETFKRYKCSLSVMAKTMQIMRGGAQWDESKGGKVACAEKEVQYVHFAMPDPDDPHRRRERPATVERDWFACRERCYELLPYCVYFSFWEKHKECYLLNADARPATHNFDTSEWVTGSADGTLEEPLSAEEQQIAEFTQLFGRQIKLQKQIKLFGYPISNVSGGAAERRALNNAIRIGIFFAEAILGRVLRKRRGKKVTPAEVVQLHQWLTISKIQHLLAAGLVRTGAQADSATREVIQQIMIGRLRVFGVSAELAASAKDLLTAPLLITLKRTVRRAALKWIATTGNTTATVFIQHACFGLSEEEAEDRRKVLQSSATPVPEKHIGNAAFYEDEGKEEDAEWIIFPLAAAAVGLRRRDEDERRSADPSRCRATHVTEVKHYSPAAWEQSKGGLDEDEELSGEGSESDGRHDELREFLAESEDARSMKKLREDLKHIMTGDAGSAEADDAV